MGEVDGDVAADGRLVEREQRDAGEVLDLADGDPHDVGQVDRAAATARRLGAGQHQQRLGVAAHAGGEVVELEQVLELVGVVLVGLELVDELDLAVEQRLVASGQVDEDVADALAQQLRLLLGDLDVTSCMLLKARPADRSRRAIAPRSARA